MITRPTLRIGSTLLGTVLAGLTAGAAAVGSWLVGGTPLGTGFLLPTLALAWPASVFIAHRWRGWTTTPVHAGVAMGAQSLLALLLPALVAAVALGGVVSADMDLATGTAAVLAALGWILVDGGLGVVACVLMAASAFWMAFYACQQAWSRGLSIPS
jgi:hypothetical protein